MYTVLAFVFAGDAVVRAPRRPVFVYRSYFCFCWRCPRVRGQGTPPSSVPPPRRLYVKSVSLSVLPLTFSCVREASSLVCACWGRRRRPWPPPSAPPLMRSHRCSQSLRSARCQRLPSSAVRTCSVCADLCIPFLLLFAGLVSKRPVPKSQCDHLPSTMLSRSSLVMTFT